MQWNELKRLVEAWKATGRPTAKLTDVRGLLLRHMNIPPFTVTDLPDLLYRDALSRSLGGLAQGTGLE